MDYHYQEEIPTGLRNSLLSYGNLGPLLTLGDRVVWLRKDGAQYAWVRWVGRIPQVCEDGWTIGLEFDNPVGSGDGRFAGRRYFFGRQDHALFLPNTNLIRAEEYHLQVAKADGFGAGNQQVVIPPYTSLPRRADQQNGESSANGDGIEAQSEPCSANATPMQNKRSMFSHFKLKKSRSLQETAMTERDVPEMGTEVNGRHTTGYDNVTRKSKTHFPLLPLRFPKSTSNTSVSSAPAQFGPPRIQGGDCSDASSDSSANRGQGLMSCLGGSLLRKSKKRKHKQKKKKEKEKETKHRNTNGVAGAAQSVPFTYLSSGADTDSKSSSLVSNGAAPQSRQYVMLQQYREQLEARSTPRMERRVPTVEYHEPHRPAPESSTRYESRSPSLVNSQSRQSRFSQLEQRRSLLTPIIPPEDDFDYLEGDRRSNSLQITRNRSPVSVPSEACSLPGTSDSQVVKKKKKRRAPPPPPPSSDSRNSLHGSMSSISSSTSGTNTNSFQRRHKKRPAPPPPIRVESVATTKSQEVVANGAAAVDPSRLNDLSRIEEDNESDFEVVLKRSDSKVNELVDAFQRLTEGSGGDMSPEVKSDDGTLTNVDTSEAESSTSTKWRYVESKYDTISIDSNTSEAMAVAQATTGASGGIRRNSVSEYRLEFERRRAFYESKNREHQHNASRPNSSSRLSRSFEDGVPSGYQSTGGNSSNSSSLNMNLRELLKSQSNTSIASKGSTGSDRRPPIHPDSPTGSRQLLYKHLEAAIARGEHDKAATIARQLALYKKKTSCITVNLYVEDKLSHVGPIKLTLNPCMTLQQLKQKIESDYRFPQSRQRWVIGNCLALNNEQSLDEIGVNKNDCNIFLYLVSQTKYEAEHLPGTPKSLPREFLDSFPSDMRHIIPEMPNGHGRPRSISRADSVNSDEMWMTAAELNNEPPVTSTAKVRMRKQVVRRDSGANSDQLNNILISQDTLKGWKCELCGMLNRRMGSHCVMCGSLNSTTSNDADDEAFDGNLQDVINLDRPMNKHKRNSKLNAEMVGPSVDHLSVNTEIHQNGKPPMSPKSRSVSQSPPRSPVFAKIAPSAMPTPVLPEPHASPKKQTRSQIPRPVYPSSDNSKPGPSGVQRSPSKGDKDMKWQSNPSFDNNKAEIMKLAEVENFDITSESGSDDGSVTSFEAHEKMFEAEYDEFGRITEELGFSDPTSKPVVVGKIPKAKPQGGERPGSVIYRPNGQGATNGFMHNDEGTSAERPTTAIFRPADVHNAIQVETAAQTAEVKHVVEDPPKCISETRLGVQPQRAVLHSVESGARPKQANIIRLKDKSPPISNNVAAPQGASYKPLVTVQPWSMREGVSPKKDDYQPPQNMFRMEIATKTVNVAQTAEIVSVPQAQTAIAASNIIKDDDDTTQPVEKLEKAIETLRSMTESPVQDYLKLMQLDDHDLVENVESFDCPICFMEVEAKHGVVLRDCLHTFCRDCLIHAIEYSNDPTVKCPFMNEDYSCESYLQEREIKALVPEDIYDKHLGRSMKQAETSAKNSFHCHTPDCTGWCFYEDQVNHFDCPVCNKRNCVTCQAIHHPLNCLQYQDQLEFNADLTEEDKKTKEFLEDMVRHNDAMHCPHCQIILIRKWGCDWVKCSMCKTEICWVTKGPRWGPNGRGDTSGGCKCGVNGVKCHPKCTYCH